MLGFERFGAAAVTIGCIELAEKIYKDRFNIGSWRRGQPPLRRFGRLYWRLEAWKANHQTNRAST